MNEEWIMEPNRVSVNWWEGAPRTRTNTIQWIDARGRINAGYISGLEPSVGFVTRDEVAAQVERLKRKLETMNANTDKDDYKNSLTPDDYSSAELDSFLSSFRKEELVNA